jgi:hypothetical protein
VLRSLIILAAVGAALIVAPVRLPAALGTATIADPQPGQALRGVVLIRGTAQQPAFDHYEVSFSYEPNPTADWFAIEAAGSSPVQNGQLASWDTTQIADGAYQLRLRVFSSDGGAPLEFVTAGLAVANSVPLPAASATSPATAVATVPITEAPAPTTTPAVASSTAVPNAVSTATAPAVSTAISTVVSPVVSPAGSAQSPTSSPYLLALGRGAVAAIAGFLALGVYGLLRPVVRPTWRRFKRSVSADLRRP